MPCPKLYFCADCIKQGIDLKYLKKYPNDYGIYIMCFHFWEMMIKPKIENDKKTAHTLK